MSKKSSPNLQIDSRAKCLEAFIFLSYLSKFKILLTFLLKVFWIDDIMYIFDYVKMNSVLKMNFILNIDPYPIPVTNIKNSSL